MFSTYFIFHLASMDLCILCCQLFEDDSKVKVTQKGLNTLIDHAKLRHELTVHEHLTQINLLTDLVFVHNACRKRYTDPRKSLLFDQNLPCSSGPQLRSSQLVFNWKQKCLFCCEYTVEDKHPTTVHTAGIAPRLRAYANLARYSNSQWASCKIFYYKYPFRVSIYITRDPFKS